MAGGGGGELSCRFFQPGSVGEALWLFYARLQDSIKEIDAWLSVTAEDVLSPAARSDLVNEFISSAAAAAGSASLTHSTLVSLCRERGCTLLHRRFTLTSLSVSVHSTICVCAAGRTGVGVVGGGRRFNRILH